ncbi:hypothetical protein DQ04_16691010, partial [Trypanosoma grayi]|uniref:hypothetical protein n=1 Tax=Trypanosoma grayi TaxID=71804 RepID=UPI0004F47A9C
MLLLLVVVVLCECHLSLFPFAARVAEQLAQQSSGRHALRRRCGLRCAAVHAARAGRRCGYHDLPSASGGGPCRRRCRLPRARRHGALLRRAAAQRFGGVIPRCGARCGGGGAATAAALRALLHGVAA